MFTTCSYGNLNATSTLNVKGIAFRDASLNTTRVQIQLTATTVITNPLSGLTATGIQHSNETFYVDDGSFVLRGLDHSITVPGAGQVLHIAGRISADGSGNVVSSTPQFQNLDLGPLWAALE